MGIGKNNMMRGGGGLLPGQRVEDVLRQQVEMDELEHSVGSLAFWCVAIGVAVAVVGGLVLQYTVG
jgi:hypothetical protein